MRIEFRSPRTRQWNQIPVSEPTATSPITAAVGAMNASAAIVGVAPFSEKTGPNPPYGRSGMHHFPTPDTFMQTEHKSDILHHRPGRTFAEIVEPRDQHGLTVLLVNVHRQFENIGGVQRLRLQLA